MAFKDYSKGSGVDGDGQSYSPITQYFEYEHLPERLQSISKPICDIAKQMDRCLMDGPEKTAGLRKLLEAKDCFVRAHLELFNRD